MKKILALVLTGVMCVGLLSACGNGGSSDSSAKSESTAASSAVSEASTASASETEPTPVRDENTPLVVGYSPFSEKFSPFFSSTAYDQDVWAMTAISLLTSDRQGAIIYKGIEGETIPYNGTDYTYYGPADLEIVENEDGTVDYNFTMRDDLVFSDGTPITIDDVIFTMYVYADPTYDGATTLFSLPIEGMEEYRTGIDKVINLMQNAGPDNTDFTYWTQEMQDAFWNLENVAPKAIAEEIVKYCVDNGYNEEGDITGAAGNWGFSIPENGTIDDFAEALKEAYAGDMISMIETENAGSSVADFLPDYEKFEEYVEYAESAPNITGIVKTGDYSMTVKLTEVSATAIYSLGVPIAPLHYYGEVDKYDYDNNMFGFTKGDLSHVRSVTTKPMGAGPYKFVKFENGTVYFEANDLYFKGAPKTKYINFLQSQDADKLNGVITGTVDITDPSFSNDTIAAIEKANGGELNGDVITVNTVDNLGYGYIGINSKNVCVSGERGSDASKNLRRAFATVFSVYRELAVRSYYGERASVINYPISNTSWAAPQATDDGYQVAFSVDVDGNPIYTSDMTDEEKYDAALQAALGFFEAAGYTVEDGKLTAAPEGAALEYEVLIPGDGTGDHPSFMILTEARDALAKIGMKLIVTDLTNSADLWTALDAQEAEMWCAAWGASVDPDMYQIYFADTANGGANAGKDSFRYGIQDEDLDTMIIQARKSLDQSYRKTLYKACLDIIIDWADEVPVYQRQNAIIFSSERVDLDTVTPDITTFYGWMSEIENTVLK
ncbi:MAG: ABC transporter substrate-binding protein [Eubacterium sp.]|nr:ABC transporter substrate-binding protein [Eubacterium sp.]